MHMPTIASPARRGRRQRPFYGMAPDRGGILPMQMDADDDDDGVDDGGDDGDAGEDT